MNAARQDDLTGHKIEIMSFYQVGVGHTLALRNCSMSGRENFSRPLFLGSKRIGDVNFKKERQVLLLEDQINAHDRSQNQLAGDVVSGY